MALKSIRNRIQVTKNGKIRRRAPTLGHSRSNKTTLQMQRKAQTRGLEGVPADYLNRTLSN